MSRCFFPTAEAEMVKKDLCPVAEIETWNRAVPEDVLGSGSVVVFQRSVLSSCLSSSSPWASPFPRAQM